MVLLLIMLLLIAITVLSIIFSFHDYQGRQYYMFKGLIYSSLILFLLKKYEHTNRSTVYSHFSLLDIWEKSCKSLYVDMKERTSGAK